jgi:predicted nuclease of restriction endonuclease-like (RecB) superfamily
MSNELNIYSDLLVGIKNRVRQGQIKAYLAVNTELLATYWDIGKMIHERQQQEGWGKGIIPRLAIDLKNELSEVKGFSERNIARMLTFYKEYQSITIWQLPVAQLEKDRNTILPLPVAKLETDENSISPLPVSELENNPNLISQRAVAKLETDENSILPTPLAKLENTDLHIFNKVSWSHHIILMQKIKDLPNRYWYMQQIVEQGWSRDTLIAQIKSNVHERQGTLVHNFDATLPDIHSQWAKSVFKDPYIFDFTTLATEFSERELEVALTKNVEKFLVELGAGFAFVGRQYHLEISDKDVYLDLLFYHLKTRCFIVIDLKKGDFLPEYAGKMNFYCSAVDDILKHETDQPTVGLILCQGKDKVFAEYTLRGMTKPIGISEYELTRILPDNLKGSLPSVEEIENNLNELGL